MKALVKFAAAGLGAAGASYATYVARTWLRYGRVERSDDLLLDRFMPSYEVGDRQGIDIEAPAQVSFVVAKELPFDRSRIVRAIFRARELILRAAPGDQPPATGIIETTKALGWGVLAEAPTQIVMGAVTKPWEANPVFRALPPDEFAAFAEPDHVKIVWSLRADPIGDAASRFAIETRAVATDPGARAKFRRYWSMLSPGIWLIRRAQLPIIKREAERRAQPLPGDDLLPEARTELTHAVDIDAPPSQVWPWLVQMGGQRAGWYSWDVLDNGGKPSADRIVPELQHLAVGDVLPFKPAGSEGFEVLRIESERLLVVGNKAPTFEGTWAFILEPVGDDRTRLVTRYRAKLASGARMSIFLGWMKALHAFMERKQLRTIKHHAEHMRDAN